MSIIRGEAKIYYKKSRGTWACTLDLGYQPDGTRKRLELTSKSRDTLIKKRRNKINEIENGTYSASTTPTVETWAEHWIDKICYRRVTPRVLGNYKSHCKHIVRHIGKRRLDKLTPDDVRYMHDQIRENGGSESLVKTVHTTLALCLKDAVRERAATENPCDRMDRPKALTQHREAFSLAEARAILTTAKGDGPGMYSRWLMALMLGSRQGECLGLEWDRVDLDKGVLDISWQLQPVPWAHGEKCKCDGEKPHYCPTRQHAMPPHLELRECRMSQCFTRPKTSSSTRIIPIPGPLREALQEWKETAPPNDYGLVWVREGLPMWGRDDLADWKNLCRRAGVRVMDLHSARHTMVSLLLDSGVSPEVIRQIAGHSTILSTRNYMHVSTDQARKALEGFNMG